MIVFLTLCYVAVLAILIKIGVIRLTLWWKLSPLAWLILLFVVLFIPMQWGAPGGSVNVFEYVVEIIPNVSGEVVDVNARALTPMKKGDVLFRIDPRPYQYRLDGLQASLREAPSDRDLAKIELERNRKAARTNAVAASDVDTWRARYEGSLARIGNISSQIDDARYDLEMTDVRAPADGYVIGLTLRPGQRVTNMPLRSWMAFVVSDATRVVAGIQQYALRHVEPGQQAEVVFKLRPGQTFSATVESVAYLTPEGQLAPSGSVPLAPTGQQPPAPYGVILKLDQEIPALRRIPGGAVGSAAVYTKSVTPTHIIRRVMLRMDSFLNYIIPS